jgi:RES domain-containing protein
VRLDGFPPFRVPAGTTLHRIHRAKNAPWWFSSNGSGRFDPVDVPGLGACYLAERELGAWVEVFRTAVVIAESDVHGRRLCSPALSHDVTLADATSRTALGFGVTASLGAGQNYKPSHEFAAAAANEGFAGVRYLLRHDPSQSLIGVALFGPAGAAARNDAAWPAVPDVEISQELIEAAADAFGYRVVPPP